jgi:hypothetical protein
MYPGLRILLMTGYPDEYPFGGEGSEVFQLMRKPFTTSELALQLEAMLGVKSQNPLGCPAPVISSLLF